MPSEDQASDKGSGSDVGIWRKAMPPGCALKPGLAAVAMLVGGVYLMGQWERLGGVGRAGSVIFVLLGSLVLLPIFAFMAVTVVSHYFMREMNKSLGGMLGAGREMVAKNKSLYTEEYESRDATEEDYAWLDRDWYESMTDTLNDLGFRHLGDVVNVTIEKATGMTTVIRRLVSSDGTTVGLLYHVPIQSARLAGKKMLTVEFESEFSDGSFLMTSNTAETNLATSPPTIHSSKHPLETPAGELAAAHEKEKGNLLAAKSGATCVTMFSMEDVTESQKRQQRVKASFRKDIGFVDPEEVRRIASTSTIGGDEAAVAIATASADIARREEQKRSEGT